jgi:hypothetical protein
MNLHLPDAALAWTRWHPRPDLLRLIERLHAEEAISAKHAASLVKLRRCCGELARPGLLLGQMEGRR